MCVEAQKVKEASNLPKRTGKIIKPSDEAHTGKGPSHLSSYLKRTRLGDGR
jgi:hypothetical protein